MDIQSVAWGIAVSRIIPPPKGGDPIVREIAIKKYADDLLLEQDRIIADFNAVVDALDGFVLVPRDMHWHKADDLASSEWDKHKHLFSSQNRDLNAIQVEEFRLRWCKNKAQQIISDYKAMIESQEVS